jgi:hypothetical protein
MLTKRELLLSATATAIVATTAKPVPVRAQASIGPAEARTIAK